MKTIGSLFAGIGGFDLGFEREGFQTAWAVEIDQKAQAVLRRHFPSAALHDDVCQVGAHNLGPVDVVTFGSPCQDLSVAGKRAGLAGERSGLFHESARIIRELRETYGKPDFAIWENVPGAFSSNAGRDFAAVIQAMVDIGARDVAWRVLDSRFAGVAQRRRRVFLVADFGGARSAEVLALAEGVRGNPAKSRAARKGIAPGARAGAGGRGFRMRAFGDYADDGTASAMKQRDYKDATDLVAQLVCATGHKTHALTRSDGATEDGTGRGTPIVNQPIAFHPTQDPISGTDVSHSLSCGSKTGNASVAVLTMQPTAGALDASYYKGVGSRAGAEREFVAQGRSVVRRLTPVECCRLQGFPDDWNVWGISKDGKRVEMADSSRYKQLGNAVTVNVAQRIARRVMAATSFSPAPSC